MRGARDDAAGEQRARDDAAGEQRARDDAAGEQRALDDAFRREERDGARLGLRARAAAIVIIALTLLARVSGVSLLYYFGVLAVLLATGYALYLTTAERAQARWRWVGALRFFIIAVDMSVITIALVVPAPGTPAAWPDAMQLRLGNIGFLFVFLVFSAQSYSPGLALWAGVAAAGAWVAGVLWILSQPGSFTEGPGAFADLAIPAILDTLLDPNYVSTIAAGQEAFLLMIAGAVMATAVWRGRRLAYRQIVAARERTKLARYFSPDLAEELAHGTEGLEEMQTRDAAIVFADIVSFTALAEEMTPEATITFLRGFHRRASGEVFAQGGTLNKFIGDEVMATFGAIQPRDDAPAAALECALGIVERVDEWSAKRVEAGRSPVRVGVGVHVGPLVVGNIGDERCLELAVLGDAVNVANRLEAMTRELDASIVASRAALDAARASRPDLASVIDRFTAAPAAPLRGRREEVAFAALPREAVNEGAGRAAGAG